MEVQSMQDSSQVLYPGCFSAISYSDEWMICAEDQETADTWIKSLKEALGMKIVETDGVAKVIKKKTLQPVIIVPIPSPDCEKDWNYNQHGSDWQCHCKNGLL